MARSDYPLWSFSREGCLLIQHGPNDIEMVADEDAVLEFLTKHYDPADWPAEIAVTANMRRFGLTEEDFDVATGDEHERWEVSNG